MGKLSGKPGPERLPIPPELVDEIVRLYNHAGHTAMDIWRVMPQIGYNRIRHTLATDPRVTKRRLSPGPKTRRERWNARMEGVLAAVRTGETSVVIDETVRRVVEQMRADGVIDEIAGKAARIVMEQMRQ